MRKSARRLALLLGATATVACSGCGGSGSPRDARSALSAGDLVRAWEASEAETRADSTSALAWDTRARVALATMRTQAGVEAARRAVELGGGADSYLVRAYLDQARFRNVAAVAGADTARAQASHVLACVRAAGELRLGGGMVGTPDYEGAEGSFRAALEIDATDVRSRFGLGQILVRTGRDSEGVEWLEQVLEQRPLWADAYYLRGVARMRERNFDAAADDFLRAVEIDPVHAAAWFNRGRVLERLGRSKEAARARQRSSVVRNVSERTRSAAVAWHGSSVVGNGLRLAALLREAGRIEESCILARTLVQDHADLAAAYLELAESARLYPDYPEALAAAERAVALAPRNLRAVLMVARIAAGAGEAATAMAHARTARELAPNDVEPVILLAGLVLDSGDAAGATALLDAVPAAARRDVWVVARRAQVALESGRPGEAESLIQSALAVQSRPEWLEIRAAALAASGRSGPARDDLRLALDLDPRRIDTWAAMAQIHEAAGSDDEVEKCRAEITRIENQDQQLQELRDVWRASPGDSGAAAALAEALLVTGATLHAGRVWEITDGFGRNP